MYQGSSLSHLHYQTIFYFEKMRLYFHNMKYISKIIVLSLLPALIGLTSCKPVSLLKSGQTLQLATSTENYVEVTIALARRENNQFFLSATFTPLDPSLHLYSKEIPRNGVEGLGRPALLELAPGSSIKEIGELFENISALAPLSGPPELRIYPAGAITLSMPVQLPEGEGWFSDKAIVTYMACNNEGCRPPVEGKAIAIRVPGNDTVNP